MPSISRFMTVHPFTIPSTASLSVARRMLDAHQIRHLPVVDGGLVVGLVLDSDVRVLEILHTDLDTTEVARVMQRDPYVVAEDAGVAEVVDAMATRKVDAAIVADGARIRGIFTSVDACEALSLVLRRADA